MEENLEDFIVDETTHRLVHRDRVKILGYTAEQLWKELRDANPDHAANIDVAFIQIYKGEIARASDITDLPDFINDVMNRTQQRKLLQRVDRGRALFIEEYVQDAIETKGEALTAEENAAAEREATGLFDTLGMNTTAVRQIKNMVVALGYDIVTELNRMERVSRYSNVGIEDADIVPEKCDLCNHGLTRMPATYQNVIDPEEYTLGRKVLFIGQDCANTMFRLFDTENYQRKQIGVRRADEIARQQQEQHVIITGEQTLRGAVRPDTRDAIREAAMERLRQEYEARKYEQLTGILAAVEESLANDDDTTTLVRAFQQKGDIVGFLETVTDLDDYEKSVVEKAKKTPHDLTDADRGMLLAMHGSRRHYSKNMMMESFLKEIRRYVADGELDCPEQERHQFLDILKQESITLEDYFKVLRLKSGILKERRNRQQQIIAEYGENFNDLLEVFLWYETNCRETTETGASEDKVELIKQVRPLYQHWVIGKSRIKPDADTILDPVRQEFRTYSTREELDASPREYTNALLAEVRSKDPNQAEYAEFSEFMLGCNRWNYKSRMEGGDGVRWKQWVEKTYRINRIAEDIRFSEAWVDFGEKLDKLVLYKRAMQIVDN